MSGECKSCDCPDYANEEITDCDGSFAGDFSGGVRGFTPATWFCMPTIPGGCSNPGCICACAYYDIILREPPDSDGCPGTSVLSFPADDDTRGPCVGTCDCPLPSFPLQNAALAIKAPVFDGSGPPGMENMDAMQLWYSGIGSEGVAWVGYCQSFFDDQAPLYEAQSFATPPSPMGTPAYDPAIDGPDANIIGTCNPPRAYRDPADYSTGGVVYPTSTWPSIVIDKDIWNNYRTAGAELWVKGAGSKAACGIQNFVLQCNSAPTGAQTFTEIGGESKDWINLGELGDFPAAASNVTFTFQASGIDIQGSPPHNHLYLTRGQFYLEIRPIPDPTDPPGTGWRLDPGDVYVLEFWAKSVPDLWGDIKTGADGYRLSAIAGNNVAEGGGSGGFLGFNFTDPDFGGSGLYLTADWRHYEGTLIWTGTNIPTLDNAQLSFARVTQVNGYSETAQCEDCCQFARFRHVPRGSVLLKCVSLHPLGDYVQRGVGLRSKHRPYDGDGDQTQEGAEEQ